MKTHRSIVVALCGALALFPLVGCGGSSDADDKDQSPKQEVVADQTTAQKEAQANETASNETQPAHETLDGGWTASYLAAQNLSDDEKAIFEEAAQQWSDQGLEPVQVLGTQVVAGRNIAYLCRMGVTSDEDATAWAVAVVYEDPEGGVHMSLVRPIDITQIRVASTSAPQDVMGGWEISVPEQANTLPDEQAQAAFAAAAEKGYEGVSLKPIALLGTQVVAGTNYLVLCEGEGNLYVAQVYEDLDGNAQISEANVFDLLAYTSA